MSLAKSKREVGRNWEELVRRLKAADPTRSNGSIARELGVTVSQVWRVLNPERYREIVAGSNARRTASKRAWANENDRGKCERCGATTCIGHSRRSAGRWCADCYVAIQRERQQVRFDRIATLWAEGKTLKQIAAALDSTPGSIGVSINTMRAAGMDVPHRRPRQKAA